MLRYKEKEKLIKHFINFFNLRIYVAISIIVTLIVFILLIRERLIIAMIYSLITLSAFDFILELMYLIVSQRFNNQYLQFVSTFASSMSITKSSISALKNTIEYIQPPLKGIIEKELENYESGAITTDEIWLNLSTKIGLKNYKQFFLLVKTAEETGANILEISKTILNNSYETFKLSSQIRASTLLGTAVTIFMIIINLILFNAASKTPEIAMYLYSSAGIKAVLFNIICIAIGILTPKILNTWSDIA